jgi:PAT family beta-lactamase induction signal transducer AmpG
LSPEAPKRLGTFRSLARAMTSWRTAAVSLLSFSSGLPLGLVWIAIPDWMRSTGMDIRLVGLISLTQAPWTFKVLWAPLLDRYVPPWLGRRRGWAAITQIALFVLLLALAGLGHHPDTPWVLMALTLAIAFASASQDIAIDAYAVEILRPEEQGVAVGARVAIYRAAMYVAGGLAITLAARWSWPAVNVGLGLLFLPMLIVTWKAPEPEGVGAPPRSLREAVWHPFLGFLAKHRALEILAFVILYKLSDNLAGALLRPFLFDMGYTAFDRGLAVATVGLALTLFGTFLGGAMTTSWGLGHSLWLFGFLQIFAHVGYILLTGSGVNRPLMYAAVGFESLTQGMGTGAFSVLLLRLTQKRFSATQYSLFSSLFSLPRIVSGPICGFTVAAVGWRTFFWIAIASGIPGLLLLQRFAPLGMRDPTFDATSPVRASRPLRAGELALSGILAGIAATVASGLVVAFTTAAAAARKSPTHEFDLGTSIHALTHPSSAQDWTALVGVILAGVVTGLLTAAVRAVRSGAAREIEE